MISDLSEFTVIKFISEVIWNETSNKKKDLSKFKIVVLQRELRILGGNLKIVQTEECWSANYPI